MMGTVVRKGWGAWMRRLMLGRRGNVSAVIALLLVPIIGGLGMAAEGVTIYLAQRGAQNVADVAAIAAAENACSSTGACSTTDGKPTYDQEAKAVAAKMGFTNGISDVTISTTNAATCPGGGTTCYGVTVSKKVPFALLSVVGYTGDTTSTSGAPATTVTATAVAQLQQGSGFCLIGLGPGDAIQFSGAPKMDLTGCSILAPNGDTSCNGQSGATIKFSYDKNAVSPSTKQCGTEVVGSASFTDNWSSLSSQALMTDPCGGSWKSDSGKTPTFNTIATATDVDASSSHCGDTKLTADVSIASGNHTLVIYNGRLELNGHKLSTASGAGLTIIFSGTAVSSGGTTYTSTFSGSGTLDYAAPTSGTWSGVAVYQNDSVLTGSKNVIDETDIGNTPAFDITGLWYAPKSKISFGGAINHATAGYACLAFIALTVGANGTGSIFANPTRECDRAGLTLPKLNDKAVLVQ